MYLVSYQKQGEAPVIYVASSLNLIDTVNQAIKEAENVPVFVSLAKTLME